MTTFDTNVATRASDDFEDAGGAFATRPEREPAESWSSLMALGAMMVVWRDLPEETRRRIASGAVATMKRADADDAPFE